MNERERAIEARVNAATPGQWFWDEDYTLLRTDKPPFEAYPNETEIIDAWYDLGKDDPIPADIDIRPTDAALIAAAPADIRYLLARVRELEADNAALQGALDDLAESNYKMTHSFKSDQVDKLKAALTPFAAVGAAVAALRDVRPQSSYAPEHAALTIGGATVTFADLIAAADVLAVRAATVGTDTGRGGIAEIAKGEQE